jgi:hypothetical protein
MKSIVLALFILMASAVQSSAQVVRSGNDIQEACEILIQSGGPKGDVESAKAGYCLGFVTALLFTGRWPARTHFRTRTTPRPGKRIYDSL